jgi:hypothetical protein
LFGATAGHEQGEVREKSSIAINTKERKKATRRVRQFLPPVEPCLATFAGAGWRYAGVRREGDMKSFSLPPPRSARRQARTPPH